MRSAATLLLSVWLVLPDVLGVALCVRCGAGLPMDPPAGDNCSMSVADERCADASCDTHAAGLASIEAHSPRVGCADSHSGRDAAASPNLKHSARLLSRSGLDWAAAPDPGAGPSAPRAATAALSLTSHGTPVPPFLSSVVLLL